jgi:hypothetical protein
VLRSALVGKRFACNAVDPQTGCVSGGNGVDSPPHDEECLSKGVKGSLGIGSAPEIRVDLEMMSTVERPEALLGRALFGDASSRHVIHHSRVTCPYLQRTSQVFSQIEPKVRKTGEAGPHAGQVRGDERRWP